MKNRERGRGEERGGGERSGRTLLHTCLTLLPPPSSIQNKLGELFMMPFETTEHNCAQVLPHCQQVYTVTPLDMAD